MTDQAAPRPSIDTVIDQIEIDLSHYNPVPRWCEMHTGRVLALVDHIRTLEATIATLRCELDAADTSIATLSKADRFQEGFRAGIEKAVAAGHETMTTYTLGTDLHFGAETVVRAVQSIAPEPQP